MYELKPDSPYGHATGPGQLAFYISVLKMNDPIPAPTPADDWRPGASYTPETLLTYDLYVHFDPPQEGVIYYRAYKRGGSIEASSIM